jgi:hypothetical protein
MNLAQWAINAVVVLVVCEIAYRVYRRSRDRAALRKKEREIVNSVRNQYAELGVKWPLEWNKIPDNALIAMWAYRVLVSMRKAGQEWTSDEADLYRYCTKFLKEKK